MQNQANKHKFIQFMVKAGVLTFGDFVTKSGRKTPYFINTGNYKTGRQLSMLGSFYARCLQDNGAQFDVLYGPAYKGIPLAAVTASALYENYGVDVKYCFNRKEQKDHGEGGSLVGGKPQAGERVCIIEDVVTAGTSVSESVPIIHGCGAEAQALIVSVDRCEKGLNGQSALKEVKNLYGMQVYAICSVLDIIEYLYMRPVDGVIYIDDGRKTAMEQYLKEYGAF